MLYCSARRTRSTTSLRSQYDLAAVDSPDPGVGSRFAERLTAAGDIDRELGVPAPITTRARGADVEVEFQADERNDTFDAQVTDADTELDEIRIMEEITAGQAELGTGHPEHDLSRR